MGPAASAQSRAARAAAAASGSSPSAPSEEPEFGTLYWVLAASIRLLAPRVLHHNEQRKAVLSTMIGLMAGQNTRHMDPSLFLEMLKVGGAGCWILLRPHALTGALLVGIPPCLARLHLVLCPSSSSSRSTLLDRCSCC